MRLHVDIKNLFSGGFTTNEISDATHVVFCNGMDASSFLLAFPSYKRKHRQHIVNVQVNSFLIRFQIIHVFSFTVVLGMFMFDGQS